jgi:hypothetical protein
MKQTKFKALFAAGFGLVSLLLLVIGTVTFLIPQNLIANTITIISLILGYMLCSMLIGTGIYYSTTVPDDTIPQTPPQDHTSIPTSHVSQDISSTPRIEEPGTPPQALSSVATLSMDAADPSNSVALTIEHPDHNIPNIDKITSQHVVDALTEIVLSGQSSTTPVNDDDTQNQQQVA